ncbi:TetR/AcrR family transcriptional regulator [Undibacterium sp. Jales W-56]|uniref:TetR/AcrR family transcriptional regulator n=1 Tax=Undibacterium sp. Jales W-56 TaxID=2897325 RepID=UPI0021D32828|nr:TetR/AcrR family transcriptional regulator [Undibacterium sp. Jales W-56]MCU6433239.1 TetR/AcrR family transcriptional regulator [Undibacterium sp. Jales W-56]
MRVSREQAAENRERILDVAAQLFREKGFDGIGVADLMKSAGLTHGGFYGHFASKEDLVAQSCARTLERSVEHWKTLAEQDPEHSLETIAASYLTTKHRDHPGRGCAIAALGADIARQNTSVRSTVTEGVRLLVGILSKILPGKSKTAKQEKALATFASMVGALVLARAVDDPQLSEDILQAVASSISKRAPAEP